MVNTRIIESTVLKVSYQASKHINWEAYLVTFTELGYFLCRMLFTDTITSELDSYLVQALFIVVTIAYVANFSTIASNVYQKTAKTKSK